MEPSTVKPVLPARRDPDSDGYFIDASSANAVSAVAWIKISWERTCKRCQNEDNAQLTAD
uniref:Uncharacterized protein n=1 Tax=Physcomitrium patens TaxID=3218 RepID=A0A2K1IGW3_PHYPA|nr:hypothetical protein PHYPA_029114 [Physcomitrium patens]